MAEDFSYFENYVDTPDDEEYSNSVKAFAFEVVW
jgi:hypothetical protein